MLLDKSFLQSRVKFFLHDHIKDDNFGQTIQLSFKSSSKTSTNRIITYPITALITSLSQEDSDRLSIEVSQSKTVDIFLEDLIALQELHPSANIPLKNFQKNVTIKIDGESFKVREERNDEGFESMIRLLCEKVTQ